MKAIGDLFAPVDIALVLNQNDFNLPTFARWVKRDNGIFDLAFPDHRDYMTFKGYRQQRDTVLAPLYDQVFDWLKEKYGIQLFPDYTFHDGFYYGYKFCKADGSYGFYWKPGNNEEPDGCHTLKEARIFAIKQALKQI